MAEIPIVNSDRVALVSAEDYDRVKQYHWYFHGGNVFAKPTGGKRVYLNRLVLEAATGTHCRYRSKDHLDNRRENIYLVTRSEFEFDKTVVKLKKTKDEQKPFHVWVKLGEYATRADAHLAYNSSKHLLNKPQIGNPF